MSNLAKNNNLEGKRQGRPKGAQNRVQKELREMILGALNDAGGQSYLVAQAHAEPKSFLALIAKVVPKEVIAQVDTSVVLTISKTDAML